MSDEGALVQLTVVETHISSSALPLLASMAGWRRAVAAVSLLHGWVPAAVFVIGAVEETIARLCGGNAAAWAQFDPSTVISQNLYNGLSGQVAVADGSDPTANLDGQDVAAQSLCALGRAHGIDCD